MPSHITHILLADELYKTGKLNNLNRKYFLTFSLGADLTKYSKVRKLSHKINQKDLILNMISYIKKHNLNQDEILLATIYGHICHIVTDNIIHPLIYEESKHCENKSLRNHTLLESHYDNYLLQEKFNIPVWEFNLTKYLSVDIKQVGKMLDYAYYQTYGYKHISRYYQLNLFLYRQLDLIYKIFNINFLKRISKYHYFLQDNSRNIDDKQFLTLYNKCLKETLKYFNKLNLD